MIDFVVPGLWLLAALLAGVLAFVVRRWLQSREAAAIDSALAPVRRENAELRHHCRALEAQQDSLAARLESRARELELRNTELERAQIDLKSANAALRRLTLVDALTGVANRRHFDDVIEREVRRAIRESMPLSVVICDIDGFKRYNDSFGHVRGDETLRLVARTLAVAVRRASDLVARYGGEEFAIILPGIDRRQAALFAERLRRHVWRLGIEYPGGNSQDRVTISLGTATAQPAAAMEPAELVAAADAAMYRAKRAGGNRIETELPLVAPVAAPVTRLARGTG